MNFRQILAIARERGVKKAKNPTKKDLIKAIQKAEGNFDCYGTAASGFCDRMDCLWREDCIRIK